VTENAATPTFEQLRLLQQGRQAGLLKRWAAGQLLAATELAELADVLPPEILVNPPPARPVYRQLYAHYAGLLGYNVRNIKRLVAVGKRARRICPLDEIHLLPTWWEEMFASGFLQKRPPSRIVDVAVAAAPPPGSADAAEPTPVPLLAKGAETAGTKVDFSGLQGVGLEAAVYELRIQLAANQKSLRTAMEAGDGDLIVSKRKKHFEDTLDLLRKTEKSLQDLQAARGDLAPVADFRADLTTLLTTMRGMRHKLADNVCTRLAAALTTEQLTLLRVALGAESQREETLLRTAKHWQRLPDGSVDL